MNLLVSAGFFMGVMSAGGSREQRGCPEQAGCTGDPCSDTGELELTGLCFVKSFHPSWFCCSLEHRALVWRRPGRGLG